MSTDACQASKCLTGLCADACSLPAIALNLPINTNVPCRGLTSALMSPHWTPSQPLKQHPKRMPWCASASYFSSEGCHRYKMNSHIAKQNYVLYCTCIFSRIPEGKIGTCIALLGDNICKTDLMARCWPKPHNFPTTASTSSGTLSTETGAVSSSRPAGNLTMSASTHQVFDILMYSFHCTETS